MHKKNIKKAIVHIAIPLAVGGIIAILTNDSMEVYKEVKQPPFSPPGSWFPIIWTILYFMMGIASYRIAKKEMPRNKEALKWYFGQLLVNAIWPIVFFNLEQYFMALLILILLMILVFVLVVVFYQLDKVAGYLLIPYFLWLCVALYLNMGIWILNM